MNFWQEDVIIKAAQAHALRNLVEEAGGAYHHINLMPTFSVAHSVRSPSSTALRECPPGDPRCFVLGAQAYLLTHDGAQMLRRHAHPVDLPVDWYLTTLRDFLEPGFHAAFVEQGLFSTSGRPSTIGHECLLCNLPHDAPGMLALFAGIALVAACTGAAAATRPWQGTKKPSRTFPG